MIGDRLPELNLWTTPGEGKRVYQPERLHLVHTPDADRARHVLLIEDTWVTGSNAYSSRRRWVCVPVRRIYEGHANRKDTQ